MTHDESTADGREAVRLERLVEYNRSIVSELSLSMVLRRVVEAARSLGDARYAAIGVLGADGGIEQFVHEGMDAYTVAAIGDLPKGSGLLQAVTEVAAPIRVPSAADDPRSAGLPEGHPPLTAFLGLPVRSSGTVFGNLYLANPIHRDAFTVEDENLLRSLATTAGIAIANARLHTEALQRHEWLQVSSEVSQRLMEEDEDSTSMLSDLAHSAQRVARADGVIVCLPVPRTPRTLEIVATSGEGVDKLRGARFDAQGSIAWEAMQLGRPLVVQDIHERLTHSTHLPLPMAINHAMVFPLMGRDTVRGAITVGRTADTAFSEADVEVAEAFAAQATVALEMVDARADQNRIAILEERARVAHNLHDNVVQRLFAAGLTIQGAASLSEDPAVRDQLGTAIQNLDETIRSLRTAIFDIQQDHTPAAAFPSRILAVVVEQTASLGFTPVLELTGSVESLTDDGLTRATEEALRAALGEIAQHARATRTKVEVTCDGFAVTLILSDDGSVPLADRPQEGLADLQRRAEDRGGAVSFDDREGGGLELFWTVPLA
ncbi:GAF domain-containing sensor histidine kinase [uncultured Friedmanniella sp.]|uniref:GAF domain-containing sensor histidine kinase n=1 Tax=uncultured Friedmanniella sp. TaxID=335381 RepID=UPI0035C98930